MAVSFLAGNWGIVSMIKDFVKQLLGHRNRNFWSLLATISHCLDRLPLKVRLLDPCSDSCCRELMGFVSHVTAVRSIR